LLQLHVHFGAWCLANQCILSGNYCSALHPVKGQHSNGGFLAVVWLYLEVAPTGWMLAPIGLLSAGPSLQVTIAYSGVTGPRFCPEAVAARQRAHLDIVLVPYWGSKPRSGPSVGGTDAELVAKLVGWPSTYLNNKHTLLVCLLLVSGAGARRCRITACAPWFNLSWWLSNHPIQPYPLDFQGRARA